MKNQQSGFTLVELIMVIVVLGILAAFALPRFADFGGDARRASIEGALGAVKSASAIVHSAALAGNVSGDTTTPAKITLEGEPIDVVFGYAAGSALGIQRAAQLEGNGDYTLDFQTSGTMKVTLGTCFFTYAQPAAINGAPSISQITDSDPETTGC